MKPGHVVQLRINPRDCQSCLDLMQLLGMDTRTLTFPQIVSLTISSLLETMRANEKLPEPDPFSYGERMAQWAGKGRGNQRFVKAATSMLGKVSGEISRPVMAHEVPEAPRRREDPMMAPAPADAAEPPAASAAPGATPAQISRLTWLNRESDMRDLSPLEQKEMDDLVRVVYP